MVAVPDGRFVVAWRGPVAGGNGILAQRFLSDGTSDGSEFVVTDSPVSNQGKPCAAAWDTGEFVVAWDSKDAENTDGYDVFGQLYSADGSKSGSNFQVNGTVLEDQGGPSLAVLATGSFVAVWQSNEPGGEYANIHGQLFAASGSTQGPEFKVNTHEEDNQWAPSAGALSDGRFLVAWTSFGQDGDGHGIFAQRFAANGGKEGDEFQLNTSASGHQTYPSVAGLGAERYVVVWRSGEEMDVFARLIGADGVPQGSEKQVNSFVPGLQMFPSVAGFSYASFIVVWDSCKSPDAEPSAGQDGSYCGIFAQRFNPDGTKMFR